MSSNSVVQGHVALDEARRAQQHESLKADVERDVESEIARGAAQPLPGEDAKARAVGRDLRARAVNEIVDADREVRNARAGGRIAQVLDYVFGVVYAMLALRFILSLIAANSRAGFVRFVAAVTDPLYAPFRNVVKSLRIEGGHVVALSIVVAIVAYAMLHFAIRGLLKLFAERRTTI